VLVIICVCVYVCVCYAKLQVGTHAASCIERLVEGSGGLLASLYLMLVPALLTASSAANKYVFFAACVCVRNCFFCSSACVPVCLYRQVASACLQLLKTYSQSLPVLSLAQQQFANPVQDNRDPARVAAVRYQAADMSRLCCVGDQEGSTMEGSLANNSTVKR
jgi:hypothetical protein